VLDLILPGLDGWAFLRAFRASAAWSEIPVVVISATAESPPGASDFLPKPVTAERLLAAVRRHCPVPLARVG
jgi:CheY-like chemotaxis protein